MEDIIISRGFQLAWHSLCYYSSPEICICPSSYSEEFRLNLSDNFRKLVTETGGTIESNFVTDFGCMLLSRSCITPEASFLFDSVNINCSSPGYERFAEFNKDLPGLGFKSSKETAEQYLKRSPDFISNIELYKHYTATFLLAGIASETGFELVAHGAEITKVITSNEQMKDPFYRIQGSPDSKKEYKNYLSRVINPSSFCLPTEDRNIMLPGCKSIAMVFTMNLKQYHHMFKHVFNNKVEKELKEVSERMCVSLHKAFGSAIRSPGEYHVQ